MERAGLPPWQVGGTHALLLLLLVVPLHQCNLSSPCQIFDNAQRYELAVNARPPRTAIMSMIMQAATGPLLSQ